MANIFINLLLVGLLLLCSVMMIIILMQRPSANAGMGASLGGGAAESVFGGETANVLLKNTIWVAVGFFLLSFLLFLWIVARVDRQPTAMRQLPLNPGGVAPKTAPAVTGNATSTTSGNTTAATAAGTSNNTTTTALTPIAPATPAGNTTAPATPSPAATP